MREKCARQQEVLKALLSRETYVGIVGQLDLSGKTLKHICEKKVLGKCYKASFEKGKSLLGIPQKQRS